MDPMMYVHAPPFLYAHHDGAHKEHGGDEPPHAPVGQRVPVVHVVVHFRVFNVLHQRAHKVKGACGHGGKEMRMLRYECCTCPPCAQTTEASEGRFTRLVVGRHTSWTSMASVSRHSPLPQPEAEQHSSLGAAPLTDDDKDGPAQLPEAAHHHLQPKRTPQRLEQAGALASRCLHGALLVPRVLRGCMEWVWQATSTMDQAGAMGATAPHEAGALVNRCPLPGLLVP